jgi:alpha-1,3-mannosyl-glycoprotein beta-1,2-N-acetylglucosaminyltransferase
VNFFISSGLFFEKHLKYIKLSEKFVPFTQLNLTYLLKVCGRLVPLCSPFCWRAFLPLSFNSQDNYDSTYITSVYQSPVVTFEELRRGIVQTTGPVRIQYNTKDQYKRATKMLGLMDDFKVSWTVLRGNPCPIWWWGCFLGRVAYPEPPTTA